MNITLLYGGRSGEHEVSINSAKGVYPALIALGHSVYLIAITLEGRWFWQKQEEITTTLETTYPLTVVPGEGLFCEDEPLSLDAAFAVTHGFGGEDGNLQGLCMLANLPLLGCDTLSSAIGMHKDIASRLFSLEGIPTVPSQPLNPQDIQWMEGGSGALPSWISDHKTLGAIPDRWSEACLKLQERLGLSLFIKPEASGSSLGVSALRTPTGQTFRQAVLEAKNHSPCVLVQSLIEPMDELECALLETGEAHLFAAGPALVVDPGKRSNHFLSYVYKYSQVDSAYLQLPSSYPEGIEQQIREYAKQAFKAIGGEGYARVDFFVSGSTIYLNEINTSPGMTLKSHFPLLMAYAGYSMEQVLQILIEHALKRKKEENLRTYRPPGA
ncbi:MAG: D-alanine--D-alanine ligase [Sphaerochaeta sp.]|nr:D-alanine--D-alanine ligase [Sphaerochaeta sp.]